MFINGVFCNGTSISPLRMQGNRGSMWIATTWVAYRCPRVSKELSWPLQHLINGHSYWKWCSFQTYSLLQWVTPINHTLMSNSCYHSCRDDINLLAISYANLCSMHSPLGDTLVQLLSRSPCQLWNPWSKCLTSNSFMPFLTSSSFESRG